MNPLEKLELEQESETAPDPVIDSLAPVRDMVSTCIQCGTCTGSCPNAFAMDLTPRQLWSMSLEEKKKPFFIPRPSPYVLSAITVPCDAHGVFRLPRR